MIPRKAKSLILNYDTINFNNIGEIQKIEFTYLPENASAPDVVFICENTDIAKFENNSLVSISEGSTEIYIQTKDGDITSNRVSVAVIDKISSDKREAQAIIDAITSIGEVSLEKQEAVDNANNLYNSAPDDVKAYVTNYDILSSSTQQLEALILEDKEKRGLTKSVYVTQHGEKYHNEYCRYIQGRDVYVYTKEDIDGTYDPCSVCNP